MHVIPVGGGHHRHLVKGEMFVDHIKRGGVACPAGTEHSSSRFEAEVPAAADTTVDDVLADLTTPVQGEVVNEFSIDTLKYNETLGQWCTHSGVDYAAKEGTPVTAALEGTVESVVHDPLMGLTVTLSHECGVKTVYAGLADTAQVVAEGVHIASGETIGSVGTSAAFEAHLGAHLHFEVITPDGFADIPD